MLVYNKANKEKKKVEFTIIQKVMNKKMSEGKLQNV